MSSINPHYTFNYSQPEAYRFSHDSVFLARRVFEMSAGRIQSNWRVLDLCAGCGIVGMDFLFHCKKELGVTPALCDFLEIQSDYQQHFEINRKQLGIPETELRFLQQNYTLKTPTPYDLILCNPPYFSKDQGKLSPNTFKNRCRFFIDASAADLLEAVARALAPQGEAFILSRTSLPENSKLLARGAGDIRGTHLIHLTLR